MPWRAKFKTTYSGLARDLMSLASEQSSEKRVELLHRITDVYLHGPDQHTTAEKYLFEEVVSQIVDKLGASHRASASAQLAQLKNVPEELVDRLASDRDIEVAGPFIRGYEKISEHTLLRVAKDGSQDHLEAIANRPVLTTPITDVVVVRGNKKVVHTLARNGGAQFSEAGMTNLVGRSENDAVLQAVLVERSDLTPAAVAQLLPMISSELADRLRGVAIEIDGAAVEAYFGEWMKDRKRNFERTEACISGIRKGDLRISDVVIEFVRSRRLLDAATVIAAMIDLDRDHTFQILTGGKYETVLLLMKSVSLTWPAVDGFLKLRHAKTGGSAAESYPKRLDYDAIDAMAARRVVRFMKVRRAAAH